MQYKGLMYLKQIFKYSKLHLISIEKQILLQPCFELYTLGKKKLFLRFLFLLFARQKWTHREVQSLPLRSHPVFIYT